eukprot:jgi/Mesvir1/11628/Mv00031-RA.1
MDTANVQERARLLFSARKYAEAAVEYKRLARAEPRCAKWLTHRATCRFHLHKHAAALDLCLESIDLDPRWSRGYEVGAQCLLALRRNQEAEALALQGLRAAPSPALKSLLQDACIAVAKQLHLDPHLPLLVANAPEGPLASDLATGMFFEPSIRAATEKAHARLMRRREEHFDSIRRGAAQSDEADNETFRALARREIVCRAVELGNRVPEELRAQGDLPDVMALYEREAEAGCTAAMLHLARVYLCGIGVPSDPPKFISWARRCIRSGPDAYWKGLGLPDQDVARVQDLLGGAYQHGFCGLDQDIVQAERWVRAAADAGLVTSINSLALLWKEMGRPAKESTVLFRRAAKAGSVPAMVSLGTRLMDGNGCARDFDKAARWLHKAAGAGSMLAVKGLVFLSRQWLSEGLVLLEAARRHVRSWKTHKSGAANGVRGATLGAEASLCLDIQNARDIRKSQGELFRELLAGGDTPPTLTEFLKGKPITMLSGEDYKALLLERVRRRRKPTELQLEAARLAEEAGKLVVASMAEPGAIAASLVFIVGLLFTVGKLLEAKGMTAEAHTRFFRPAAKMGDAQSCHVAGRYLAEVAKSGRELRAARRLLSQAAAREVPGAQDDLDALTARLGRGDLFPLVDDGDDDDDSDDEAGVGGGAAGSKGGDAAGFAERGSDGGATDEELRAVWDLLKLIHPHVDEDAVFVPGGPEVHIPMLEAYVSSHTGSLSGWSLLYSLRHFQRTLLALVRGDYAAAISELCFAYLFDSKGVFIPASVHGRLRELPALQALLDAVDRELAGGPPADSSSSPSPGGGGSSGSTNLDSGRANEGIASGWHVPSSPASRYFQASVVKMFTARDSGDRVRLADSALRAAPPHLVPALQRWRGAFAFELGDHRTALADAAAAGKLLRDDARTSLWPYTPQELVAASTPPVPIAPPSPSPSPSALSALSDEGCTWASEELKSLRKAMASALEYDTGRCKVELGQPRASLAHFRRFQQGVPEDTCGLPESYSDFAYAVMMPEFGPLVGEGSRPGDLYRVLEEADRAMNARLPVFQPLFPEQSLPLLMRMSLDALAGLGEAWPDDAVLSAFASAATRARPAAQEESRGDNPAGSRSEGVAGGSGAAGAGAPSTSQGGGGGAAKKACVTCGARAASLSQCGRCRLVHYCSRECQKKHWKEGHREACAKLAS